METGGVSGIVQARTRIPLPLHPGYEIRAKAGCTVRRSGKKTPHGGRGAAPSISETQRPAGPSWRTQARILTRSKRNFKASLAAFSCLHG